MSLSDTSTLKPARRSAGTIAGLRQPLTWPSERPFRILSIDGGGIKGIFPASILADLEHRHCEGRSAGDYFDLIAGTSTGGIIALGLSLGLPASRILKLYTDHGAAIFPRAKGLRGLWRKISGLWRYTYERDALKAALEDVFQDRVLGEARRRLCIPSFEGTFGEVVVFKTPHHPDFKMDWCQSMVTVALATAAAPTFFKTYKSGDQVYADGGVWANNPVMIALVDALSCHDLPRRQVQILSISCGDQDVPFTKGQIKAGGLLHWREIIKAAMHLSSLNATGQAGLLIGRDRLVRIEPNADAARLNMDDVEGAIDLLPAAAAAAVEENHMALASFFDAIADEAPAFHGPRGETAPTISFA